MALETLTIEVRVDHADPAKDKLVQTIMRQHAKSILTSCMLLQDKRAPQISLMSSNMFEREQEISLADTVDEITVTPENDTDGQV